MQHHGGDLLAVCSFGSPVSAHHAATMSEHNQVAHAFQAVGVCSKGTAKIEFDAGMTIAITLATLAGLLGLLCEHNMWTM